MVVPTLHSRGVIWLTGKPSALLKGGVEVLEGFGLPKDVSIELGPTVQFGYAAAVHSFQFFELILILR